jgi:hypothetical protein
MLDHLHEYGNVFEYDVISPDLTSFVSDCRSIRNKAVCSLEEPSSIL